ncbi:MAG: FAD-dependent oxidoreductase, partial [Dehalococcoidales bacterium]|nr:FAD-dependent oxidoreductase [Dehalococcoidales bacterium]
MKFERYGLGIAKGLGVTIKYLWRHPITTQYPEQRLTTSRRIRGNELIWDKERCSGCTTCARTCPQGAIFITTSKDVINFAPCSQACPAGIEIPRYLRFITEGKPAEAVAIIREKIPFPFVCGRVCIHPCEKNCQRTQLDGAISIRALKRYATDHDATLSWKENSLVAASTGKRVAVVGGGPAGLTAAYYLAKLGHKVTVYEALPEPGGMMRVGIPDYRLPKNLLKAEIKEIENVGVEIKTNARVESLDKLFAEGFQAVF